MDNKICSLGRWASQWRPTQGPYEHKHCDNVATNSNSEKARSRMVSSLVGSVGAGTQEEESSTGRVWAAGFRHVTARSGVARVLKLTNRLFL